MIIRTLLSFAGVLSLTAVTFADPVAPAPGEGFSPLFNEVNLVGWMVTNGHARDWRVEEGEIVVSGRSPGAARELRTAREYRDFELHFEFMMSEGGNSGLFLRMTESDPGLEIQLLDDDAEKHANLQDWQYSGALYGMAGPAERVSRPAGEWQEMIVRLEGQKLSVVLNGSLIVDTDLDQFGSGEREARWREALRRTGGHLGLQNYGTETRFRNLWIRALDED